MKEYQKLVYEFRKAIDCAVDNGDFDDDLTFRRFPSGCCGDTSDLLAEYLFNHGFSVQYVRGTYRNGTFEGTQTHAWLICEGNIIDITGDQFSNRKEFLNFDKPVYIGKKGKFHSLFEVERRDVIPHYGIRSLGEMCQPRLYGLYNTILQYI